MQNKFGDGFEFFDVCPVIHAEMSAILSCKVVESCKDALLYLLGINCYDNAIHKKAFPCPLCLRHIVHVGVKTIRIVQDERSCLEFRWKKGEFQ